jgi:hypothetical protein
VVVQKGKYIMALFPGMQPHGQQIEPDLQQRFVAYNATRLIGRANSSGDRKWAPYVRTVSIKKLTADDGRLVYRFRLITIHPDTPPNRWHYFTVRARNANYKGLLSRCPALKIQCDCERFVFYYEYANWHKGVSDILRCNGEFPIETNPSLRVGACKHALVSLTTLINRGL